MTDVVVDSSVVVAALVDAGPTGVWADSLISSHSLIAPAHLLVESAASLRRLALRNIISAEVASLAHEDLLRLRVRLFPYAPFGPRVWQLRENITPYDASLVALAEHLGLALATVDGRLARAPGIRCPVVTPASG